MAEQDGKEIDITEGALDAEYKRIQLATFFRWCNEQLRPSGKQITDLQTGFHDGVNLLQLVQHLIDKRGAIKTMPRYNKRTRTTAQRIENIQRALDLITKDEGVYVVNVRASDNEEGVIKIINGLIWTLVFAYHVNDPGSSTYVRKQCNNMSYMRAWLDAVTNEHLRLLDWNTGIPLSALINYCDPTLMTNFKTLEPDKAIENCTAAMQLAEEKFGIPVVLSPEDMSNPHIDELSLMTYLGYFLRQNGRQATLKWVREKVPDANVQNFVSDWNDGRVLCALAEAAAEGACPEWRELDAKNKLANCQKGIDAATKLGVQPTLTAKEFASSEVDEYGVMAYAARFQQFICLK